MGSSTLISGAHTTLQLSGFPTLICVPLSLTVYTFAEKVFPENPRFFPMWVMLLTNESGGQDKAQRLVGMMRSLNVPAGRLGNDVFPEVDHPDPDKGVHGGYFDDVLLPAWNVTLERNIGFGYKDKFTPIDHLFRKYDPGCRIKSDPYVAEHLRFSAAIFSCDSSVVHRPLDETFVDNLASEIDRLFKSTIEAATDSDVEADPIKVGGTQSCFSGYVAYRHPEAFGLRLMKDELAELLRKEEAILEEVREDLYYLTVDLLGRTTTASILSTGHIYVIFSYCE